MGLFKAKLPAGFSIQEQNTSHGTEYRLFYNGKYTDFSTYQQKVAVNKAIDMARGLKK